MDMNILRGIVTLVTMVLFILVCVRVFSKKNKSAYDKAAHMAVEKPPESEELEEKP